MAPRIQQIPQLNLSPIELAQLRAMKAQQFVLPWPYFSKVKFVAPRAGQGPYTYTLPTGKRLAFSYAINQDRLAAGYLASDGPATPADTNLTQQSATTSGEEVAVRGVAISIMPAAFHVRAPGAATAIRPVDAQFLAALDGAVSTALVLNSNQRFNMGLLHFLAGAGGFMGGSPSLIGSGALAGEPRGAEFVNNGWPVRSNFMRIPEGFTWRPSGNADAQLNVEFELQRAITLYSGGSPENNFTDVVANNAFDAVATGTQGYAYPEELAIELCVELIGTVTSKRSDVS